MFIVPDDILEELICDYCHKYLSVGPVKTNNERKIICGRCSNDCGTGVVSVYRYFGENAIFRCINRFNGCNELLTYNEVAEHEKQCVIGKLECPLCEIKEIMPTFKLLRHFKNEHPENFLKTSTLKRKISDLKAVNKFLYFKENFIFFIVLLSPKYTRELFLSAFYFANGQIWDVQQKFFIYIDNQKMFESNKMKCSQIEGKGDICIIYSATQVNSNVEIHFEFFTPFRLIQINCKNKKQFSNSSKMKRNLQTEKSERLQKAGLSISDCNKKLIMKDDTSNKKVLLHIECMLCSKVSVDNIYITSDGEDRYLICEWCTAVVETDYYLLKYIMEGGFQIFSDYLKFSCIWNCGIFNTVENIHKHEIDCLKMNKPRIKCPFPKCYFNGIFDIMRTHLLQVHDVTFWSNFIILYKEYKTYPDYNILSFTDKVEFYFWVHPTALIKCVVEINSDNTFIIKTMSVDKDTNIDNIKVVVTNNIDKCFQKYCMNFINQSGRIDISLLPIRLHFIFI